MRFIKLTALSTLCLLLFSFTAYAGEARINFSDPSVTSGDTVNVSMKITADDGTAIGSADIVLSYPTEKLEFVSGTDADGGAGSVRVHGASNGAGSSLVEYNLAFRTISAGSASVTIASQEVYDISDNPVTITHEGSSTISIVSADSASSDAALALLEVYPGELEPAFSTDIDSYDLTVGLGVERLTINADPSDASSSIVISGNDALPEGDSDLTVEVSAADGVSVRTYTVHIHKVEGGPDSIIGQSEYLSSVEGVQLSSKGKTITIMTPADDVAVPEGLKEGVIKIDDQKVMGWVLDQDEEPEYCVVYGMNDQGELHFYRYDLQEKSIQRYFADPLVAGSVSGEEYEALEAERDALSAKSSFRLIIILILALIAFVLAAVSVYLSSRLSTERLRAKEQKSREMKVRRDIRAGVEVEDTLGFDTDSEDLMSMPEPLDETHVIKKAKRRRRRHTDPDAGGAEGFEINTLGDETVSEESPDMSDTEESDD